MTTRTYWSPELLTTYRVMAKDAVDPAVENFADEVARSRTDQVPLFGAVGFRQHWDRCAGMDAPAYLSIEKMEQMLGRYGAGIDEIFEILDKDPDHARPLQSALPWPSPCYSGLGSLLSPCGVGLTTRQASLYAAAARLLPPTRHLTLGSDAGRFPPTPPVCYGLPGDYPDGTCTRWR
jgi:hypothetical protein